MSPAALPAATLILLRPGAGGTAEVLMVERGRALAFAAGAMVFPGGRVDPGDRDVAAAAFPGMAADEAAARVAAVRETIEEAGVAVGITPCPPEALVAEMRAALAAGEAFGDLLDRHGLRLAADALTPFARWRPDVAVSRVFDTMFFLAEAPVGARADADGHESVRAVWMTPRAILDAADAGECRVIFPTRRNLERLAGLASIAVARAHAADFPVELITPYRELRDGVEWLCIPEGRGYPITAEPMSRLRRG